MSKLIQINPSELSDHPKNPRLTYRETVIDRISAELSRSGEFPQEHALKIYQPNGEYVIVAGHHRKRAAVKAGVPFVWAWLDEDITEDEAYIQLLTSNEQDANSSVEMAVHAFNWCVPSQGKSSDHSITDYAERMGMTKSTASELRSAGDFEVNTNLFGHPNRFNPSSSLWMELSKADRAVWQLLRESAEVAGWTVKDASGVVKRIKELFDAIPDWYQYDKIYLAQMAIQQPTEAGKVHQGFKDIQRLIPTLSVVTVNLFSDEIEPTEKTELDGREHWVVHTTPFSYNQVESFKENLGDEFPTPKSTKTAYDAVISYSREHNAPSTRYIPVLTDEEHEATRLQVEEQARMERRQHYTPYVLEGDSLLKFSIVTPGTVNLVAIDPPYNVGKAAWDHKGGSEEYRKWLLPYLVECHKVLRDDGVLVLFGVPQKLCVPQCILENDLGMFFQNWVTWHIPQGGNNGSILMRRHEDILIYSKTGQPYFDESAVIEERSQGNAREYKGKVYDTKNIGDVWSFPPVDLQSKDRTAHPTQKPVALMERIVSIFCPPDGIVLDCFGGSGTTSVAAINTKRRSVYMEVEPTYIEIAQSRFQQALNVEGF